MADRASALPDYSNPPVNEVVFGIQFQNIDRLQSPHIGLFWEKLGRDKFPRWEEMPPINHIVEAFNGPKKSAIKIETYDKPPLPRLLFINSNENHLVQVQQDRFLQNWRKLKPDDTYPRFRTLYPEFKKSWEFFNSYLNDMKLPKPIPDQYELTYVNQITQGEGWKSISDIEKIFRDFRCDVKGRFLPEPETITWRKIYRLPNQMGRLHTSLKTASTKEGKNVMLFELTARGFGTVPIDDWFEMGREWIVRGFTDLTTESIQKALWHLKQ
jgi:uncharacterized protein (TIGR04255 family)